jgi:hypothetical protein
MDVDFRNQQTPPPSFPLWGMGTSAHTRLGADSTQLRLNISMETRILRLEDEFWRIRTDTGELAETERNALRAYLDEKGFKTAIIDDNLFIAGKLTWTEVFEPIDGFYEGKADVYPF